MENTEEKLLENYEWRYDRISRIAAALAKSKEIRFSLAFDFVQTQWNLDVITDYIERCE